MIVAVALMCGCDIKGISTPIDGMFHGRDECCVHESWTYDVVLDAPQYVCVEWAKCQDAGVK